MNRLTKRNGHYCDDCGYEPGEFCACNEEIAMYERLKQYEDAEEQGRLVEVRHGRWIWLEEDEDDFETDIVECSYCRKSYTTLFSKESFFETFKYCPNCGAKMDEGQDE